MALPPMSGFALIAYMPVVSDWLRGHPDTGILIYTGAFIVLAGLALLPTYAQAALGGFAFGMLLGLPAALVGFTGGAILGYEIARRASGERVLQLLKEQPRWQAIRDALVNDRDSRGFFKTVGMVALLRCPPNSPFALTNLVMASVRVPRLPFALGTMLGMIPRTALAVYLGHAFGLSKSGGFETPLWLTISGVVAMMIVIIIVMEIAERAVHHMIAPTDRLPYSKSLPKKILRAVALGAVVIAIMVFMSVRAKRLAGDPPAAPAVLPTGPGQLGNDAQSVDKPATPSPDSGTTPAP
ncbi:MAG: VTT domain-containing protein [Phycisphaerales bacterium]|nr:VTT domain-containing protein [Phycisphaerales bacterium]